MEKAYPLFILINECCPFSLIWNMISFILLSRSLSIVLENSIHYLVIKIYGVSNVLRYCNSHCPKNRNGIVKKVQHRNWYGNKRHLCQTSFTSNHLRLLCLFVLAFLCLSWIHLMWIIENMDKKEHIMSKKLCNIF